MRERKPLPKAIRDAPELFLGLEFIWTSFWDLNTCRNSGWGMGPIAWSVIIDYARTQELDQDELPDFIHLIRQLDKAYLEWHAAQQPDSSKK